MTTIELTPAMREGLPIVSRLEQAGHEAVFVGGAVRDAILGLSVKDVDIATSARPEQVMEMFPKSIPTGLAHGTVTVMLEGTAYEVTTYRQESGYVNHRKPDEVSFATDLEGDLQRRDFTVNAMALRGDGRVFDPYNGFDDLKRGVLRCVGNANERFNEDALRMVRAVRFIGVYGFQPALSAWRSLMVHKELLKHVAMERISAELDKMLDSRRPARCMAWLQASGLLQHTKSSLGGMSSLGRSTRRDSGFDADRMKHIEKLDLRWAYLWISVGITVDEAIHAMEVLRMSGKRMQRILPIIKLNDEMNSGRLDCKDENGQTAEDIRFIRLILQLGERAASDWLLIMGERDACATDRLLPAQARLAKFGKLLEDIPLRSVKELDVNGAELAAALDKKPGPWLKISLDNLLLWTALGRLENNKKALVTQAAAWQEEEREKLE